MATSGKPFFRRKTFWIILASWLVLLFLVAINLVFAWAIRASDRLLAVEALHHRALRQADRGNLGKSESLYRKAIKRAPVHAAIPLFYELAALQTQGPQPEKALATLRGVIRLAPGSEPPPHTRILLEEPLRRTASERFQRLLQTHFQDFKRKPAWCDEFREWWYFLASNPSNERLQHFARALAATRDEPGQLWVEVFQAWPHDRLNKAGPLVKTRFAG